jgi:hypothetical protein
MIPAWLTNGGLPPGVHFATWREIEDRLSLNLRRRRLLAGFRQGCEELRKAGCLLVYLDGSFVTRKEHAGDFDACWDIQNVDDEKLDPVFWDFSRWTCGAEASVSGRVFPSATPGRRDRQGIRKVLPGEQADR